MLDDERGQLGLIATNTLAQGDTREVGLDHVSRETARPSAPRSRASSGRPQEPTSSTASFGGRGAAGSGVRAIRDGEPCVGHHTESLDPAGRVARQPERLAREPRDRPSRGSNVLGLGFTLDRGTGAADDRTADPRNAEVLFPLR